MSSHSAQGHYHWRTSHRSDCTMWSALHEDNGDARGRASAYRAIGSSLRNFRNEMRSELQDLATTGLVGVRVAALKDVVRNIFEVTPFHLLPPNRPQCANVYGQNMRNVARSLRGGVRSSKIIRSCLLEYSSQTLSFSARCPIVRLGSPANTGAVRSASRLRKATRISPGPGIRGISKGICSTDRLNMRPKMPQVTSPEGDAAEEMLVVVAESCRGFVCRSSFFSVTNLF